MVRRDRRSRVCTSPIAIETSLHFPNDDLEERGVTALWGTTYTFKLQERPRTLNLTGALFENIAGQVYRCAGSTLLLPHVSDGSARLRLHTACMTAIDYGRCRGLARTHSELSRYHLTFNTACLELWTKFS